MGEYLRQASAVVVGTGGLGSASSWYLALAGIGRLGLVDADAVEISNLQRQVIHSTSDLGRAKVESAAEKLRLLRPDLKLDLYPVRLTVENAPSILAPFDVVVDACDNFATRYVLNDTCQALSKPLSFGAVFRFEGQASLFFPGQGPCLRCLFPEPPPEGSLPSPAEAGVFGPVPGLIGCLQAMDVVRYLTGTGETYRGRLLLYDARLMTWDEVILQPDPHCPVCGGGRKVEEDGERTAD